MKTIRKFIAGNWLYFVAASVGFVVISVILGYVFGWEWVGVTQFTVTTGGEPQVYTQKTLWDWVSLLVVPAVLAFGVWWLNKTEKENEREITEAKKKQEQEEADKRREQERELADKNRQKEVSIARDRPEQETLERYFDRMTDLMLEKQLRENARTRQGDEAQTIARARTLAVLRNLGPERKGNVIQFLYESQLIGTESTNKPVVVLDGADLVDVQLEGAKLQWVNLERANLEGANLAESDLEQANLGGLFWLGLS